MARNRVIYQSEALYVGPTGLAGATADQLIRVQDVSHTVDVARQDVNEFGKLAALGREVVEPPSVGTDFTYYLTNGINESGLGFSLRGFGHIADINCVSGLIGEDRNLILKNYYVKTVPEGADASKNTTTDACSVIGVGNGFITDYTLNASVGDIPSVSVSLEAANMNFVTGSMTAGAFTIPANQNPAIMNLMAKALVRPYYFLSLILETILLQLYALEISHYLLAARSFKWVVLNYLTCTFKTLVLTYLLDVALLTKLAISTLTSVL